MKPTLFSSALMAALLSAIAMLPVDAKAQTAYAKQPTPLAASAPTAVTPLIPFSGTVLDGTGRPRTGSTAITFLIYQDEVGGEPLFTESQQVPLDGSGRYAVQLGASLPNGLPMDVFANGAARWLEVQVAGETPRPRTLLSSVPYSLKAGDAATLGGLSAESFVTQAQLAATSKTLSGQAASQLAATPNTTATTPTGSGATNFVPRWTSSSTLGDSALYQSGNFVGVGTTTPAAPLHVVGGGVTPALILQSGAGLGALQVGADAGANTLTPSVRKVARITMPDWAADSVKVMFLSGDVTGANSNDLYLGGSPGSADYAATGLHFVTASRGDVAGGTEYMTLTNYGNLGIGTKVPSVTLEVNGQAKFDGLVSFASGQTFPGAGMGTITGVTAGTGLTGGGTTGAVNLNVDTTQVPLLGAATNSFSGSMNVSNTVSTSALNVTQPIGVEASPNMVIQADDNGIARQAAQQLVIQGATIPDQQLLMGYITDGDTNSNGGVATIQATWKNVINTTLSLQPNGGCVCVRMGGNAIAYANYPFAVGQGQGAALADGWYTYSSRRFKTDIQTLPDALQKIEKMRGVSYTLKATGKREIGVIAEEVGAVVPEAVTWEANGKDARGVDYNRLTAVLIEATKEQQKEIEQQRKELNEERVEMKVALQAIKTQQRQIRMQTASIAALKAQQRVASTKVNTVNRSLVGTEAALFVASR